MAFNRHLKQSLQDLQQAWSDGAFTSELGEKTLQLNANALGQCEVLTHLIELTPQQFLEQTEQ